MAPLPNPPPKGRELQAGVWQFVFLVYFFFTRSSPLGELEGGYSGNMPYSSPSILSVMSLKSFGLCW